MALHHSWCCCCLFYGFFFADWQCLRTRTSIRVCVFCIINVISFYFAIHLTAPSISNMCKRGFNIAHTNMHIICECECVRSIRHRAFFSFFSLFRCCSWNVYRLKMKGGHRHIAHPPPPHFLPWRTGNGACGVKSASIVRFYFLFVPFRTFTSTSSNIFTHFAERDGGGRGGAEDERR